MQCTFKCVCLPSNYFRYTKLQWIISVFRAVNAYSHYLIDKETYARGSQPPQAAIRLSRYKLVGRGIHRMRQLRCILKPSHEKIAICRTKCKYYVFVNTLCATFKFTPILIYKVYQYWGKFTRVIGPVFLNTTYNHVAEGNKRVKLRVHNDNG